MSDADLRPLLEQASEYGPWEPCIEGEYMDSDGETVWLSDDRGNQLAVGKHDVAAMLNALLDGYER